MISLKKLSKLIVIMGFPVASFASAGAYLTLENNCNDTDVSYQISGSDSASYNVKPHDYVSTQKLSTGSSATYNISIRSNDQRLDNFSAQLFDEWTKNTIKFDQLPQGLSLNLLPNVLEFNWHATPIEGSFVGTPTFTITKCPYNLDISQSTIFNNVKRVLFFGDSLSDNGNLSKVDLGVLPKSTPYYNGMFSNGNPWSEQLNQVLSTNGISVSNYAVGGATSVFNIGLQLPYSLGGEYEVYQLDQKHFLESSGERLAFVLIGANDYLDIPNNKTDDEINSLTDTVVKNAIAGTINGLINSGIKKFVVIDLPNLGKTPECRQKNNCEVAAKLSGMHNMKLKQLISEYSLANPSATFKFIDIAPLFDLAINDVNTFNKKFNTLISDVDTPCWDGGYTLQSVNTKTLNIGNTTLPNNSDILEAYAVSSNGQLCNNPSNHIFWDHVHPTYQMHKALFQYISDELNGKITTPSQ